MIGAGSFLLLFLLAACGQKDTDLGKEVLIRVGDRNLTVLEYNDAFEIAKIAYDDEISEQPEDLRNAQIRLLNELTVEMILLEEAQKLEINVTDQELEKAVSEIKSDYPDGEFEKTLLEFAVSYDSWKSRLKNRLIINKVIEEELASKITITPEDVTEYYQEHYQGRETESESGQPSEDINEAIVKQLRRQKAEEKYHSWIEALKAQYAIEINSELWEKLTGSKSVQENEKTIDNGSGTK
ncbi:MAG: SurA N-terminal domain-containing protein [Desulfobacterales bacterium]